MKKVYCKVLTIALTFVIMLLPSAPSYSAAKANTEAEVNPAKVLEARFLNMLNHNYVYGEDFSDLEKIVNNSVVALLDKRCTEDESFIDEKTVNSYLFDMFGFTIEDFSLINQDFDYKEGYVYILPRGFSLYEHQASLLTENQDGSYTFETKLTIKSHDGCEENLQAKTLFIKNPSSAFGFNIVNSEII